MKITIFGLLKKTLFLMLLTTGANCLPAQSIPVHPNVKDAQGRKQGWWVFHYDDNWQFIEDRSKASFYRVAEYKDDKTVGPIRDYYLSGQVQMQAMVVDQRIEDRRWKDTYDGPVDFFRTDGTQKEQWVYARGTLKEVTYFRENGSPCMHWSLRTMKRKTMVLGNGEQIPMGEKGILIYQEETMSAVCNAFLADTKSGKYIYLIAKRNQGYQPEVKVIHLGSGTSPTSSFVQTRSGLDKFELFTSESLPTAYFTKVGNKFTYYHGEYHAYSNLRRDINALLDKADRLGKIEQIAFDAKRLYVQDNAGNKACVTYKFSPVPNNEHRLRFVFKSVRSLGDSSLTFKRQAFDQLPLKNHLAWRMNWGVEYQPITLDIQVNRRGSTHYLEVYAHDMRFIDDKFIESQKAQGLALLKKGEPTLARHKLVNASIFSPQDGDLKYHISQLIAWEVKGGSRLSPEDYYNMRRYKRRPLTLEEIYGEAQRIDESKPSDGPLILTLLEKLSDPRGGSENRKKLNRVQHGKAFLEDALAFGTQYQEEVVRDLSDLYQENLLCDDLVTLHEKYGYTPGEESAQQARVMRARLLCGQFDEAKLAYDNLENAHERYFFLGVIAYLQGQKSQAMDLFQKAKAERSTRRTLFNLCQVKMELKDPGCCACFEELFEVGGWWEDAAYKVLYDKCGMVYEVEVPDYRQESYDAGGYNDASGRYIPNYQTRDVWIGSHIEQIVPGEVDYPVTGIFISK